ncbi:MAG: ribonuclease D, partial [Chloroflexota bacterium]
REAVETVIQHIHAAKQVALDTEADSLHNYFEKVCLIQLSLDGDHYLVDPLAQLDLSGLLAVLADKPLVLHGADYDLRMLRASTGFRPRREVFDTMVAAQLLGLEQLGLAALIERYFEISIGKAGQKSDWSRRPLREQQLIYAVNDTRFLEPLAEQLRAELGARGRIEWHRQSCQAMVESTGRDRSRDPANGWRINGAGRLTRRQLAYLRELWCWRDEQARAADLPAFKVFGNEPLFELLQWAESHPEVPLHQGPKLPRNIRGARLQRLEEALARAASLKPAEWPQQRILKRNDGVPADGRERFVALRGECARIAADLGIAASTLAPRAAIEAIARGRLRSLDEITKSAGLLRWQAELVQGAVDQVENVSKN